MKLFIDTSIFVDVLKKRVVASSKSLSEIVTRNIDHFERIEDINPFIPEDLGF